MNRQLGALGGVAMLLIILNHSIHMGDSFTRELGYMPVVGWGRDILSALQALGVFGVPIFFFISGSFVAYAARGTASAPSHKFVWAMSKHILPPYLVWSVVFYILVYLHRGERSTLFGYLHNLVVGYPFHFIPLLLFYYLVSPLLVRLARRFGWLLVAVVALYQMALLNVREPGILGFVFPGPFSLFAPPILANSAADWGIYFPLGMVVGLHTSTLRPWLYKLRWILLASTIVLFVLGLLDARSVLSAPIARFVCPLPFLLLVPLIDRNALPIVRELEAIGRRSYGLYLTHLIVLDTVLLGVQSVAPWMCAYAVLLYPFLFLTALQVPLLVMGWIGKPPAPRMYRYVFG